MNNFVKGALLVIVRVALLKLKLPFDDAMVQALVDDIITVVVTVWGIYSVFKAQQRTLTAAQAASPMSEKTLDIIVKSGETPSVFSDKHAVPK